MLRSVLLALALVPVLLFCTGCPFIEVSATASVTDTQTTDVNVDVDQSTCCGPLCAWPCESADGDPKPDPQSGDSALCSNQGLVLEELSNGEIRVTYPGGFGGGNAYLRITAGGNQLIEIMSWDSAEAEIVFDAAGQHGDVTVVAANNGPTIHCVY